MSSSLPSAHCWIELPRHVRRTKHENPIVRIPDSLHLDQELGLDAPRRVALAFRSIRAQRVDFVDEDDRRLALAGHIEQVLHEPMWWWCTLVSRRYIMHHKSRCADVTERCTLTFRSRPATWTQGLTKTRQRRWRPLRLPPPARGTTYPYPVASSAGISAFNPCISHPNA